MRRSIAIPVLFLSLAVAARADVSVLWFYAEGCYRCSDVGRLVARVERKHADDITVERLELTNPANYKRMMALERKHGISTSSPMVMFVGDRYLLGHERIVAGLLKTVREAVTVAQKPVPILTDAPAESGTLRSVSAPDIVSGGGRLFDHMRPWLVAGAGLADGLNPCAFATIVFLVSILSSRGLARRDMVAAGLTFSVAVFLSYLLMGFGAFKVIYRLRYFHAVSAVFYWLVAAGMVALGVVSTRDACTYRKTGTTRDILLKLPGSSRDRIHAFMRGSVRSRLLLPGCFAAGIVVSVLEVVCTGQVYLPTIMVMVQDSSVRARGIGYLLLYNTMFIIPLLAVLALFVSGVSLGRFTRFSRRSFFAVRILLAALFFGLAVLLLVVRR